MEISEFLSEHLVIGFTGTLGQNTLKPLESETIGLLGIQQGSYWPADSVISPTPNFDNRFDYLNEEDLWQHIREALHKMPVLVYSRNVLLG